MTYLLALAGIVWVYFCVNFEKMNEYRRTASEVGRKIWLELDRAERYQETPERLVKLRSELWRAHLYELKFHLGMAPFVITVLVVLIGLSLAASPFIVFVKICKYIAEKNRFQVLLS